MARFLTMVVVSLVCLAGVGVEAKDEKVRTIKGWGEVIDPGDDCKIQFEAGKVTVKVPDAAHDFAGELGIWNAPRIMSEITGDFILEVTVSGKFGPVEGSNIQTRRSYNGAGLLLVKDKNNHLSLQRGCVHLGDKIRHYMNFELRRDAELAISLFEVELEDKETILRLERRGDKIYGLASHDGINWKTYDPIEVDFPDKIAAGVEVINSSMAPFECSFEKLELFRKAETRE